MTDPRRVVPPWVVVVLLVVVGSVLTAPGAAAHSTTPAGVVSVAATLGDRELTVTFSLPTGGRGPLPVTVSAQGQDPEGLLTLEAVPGTIGGVASSATTLRIDPGSRSGKALLQIDRPGPWQVVIGDGRDAGRIPLTINAPVTPGWVWALRSGLGAAVVALIAAAALAVRRRPRWAAGFGAVTVAGVAVAATAALLPSTTPPVGPGAGGWTTTDAASATDTGMPGMDMVGAGAPSTPGPMSDHASDHMAGRTGGAVVLTAGTSPPAPRAGTPTELALTVTDGSTGRPVDDLAIHDDALIHLAVISPGGRLWHVHPVRTGPGRFSVRLTPTEAGRYGVFAELERGDGGHQVTRTAFTVAGPPGPEQVAAAPQEFPGPGTREVSGMTVTTELAPAPAGQTSRMAFRFSENGRPVRDLQAWLGMAAHLMSLGPTVVDPATATPSPAPPVSADPTDPALAFAHVHDMEPPSSVGGWGPHITFTYAFPRPGRYQLWAQVQHGGQLVTIPFSIDVAPPTPTM